MAEIHDKRIPERHAQVAARSIEGQEVVLYADTGDVNILNDVGTRIWELIDGKRSVDDIVEVIVSEYKVTPEMAARDVGEFLQDLARREAIVFNS